MPKYLFDVKVFAAIRVTAVSESEARENIRTKIDGATANLGCWDTGEPILAEVSIDGDLDLIEIDGEPV